MSCLLRTAITKTFSTTKHTANSTHRTRVSRQCCRPITLAQHQSAVPPSKSLHIHARFPPEDLKHPSPQLRLAIAPQRRAPLLIDKQTLCPIPVILDSNLPTPLSHISRVTLVPGSQFLLLLSSFCCSLLLLLFVLSSCAGPRSPARRQTRPPSPTLSGCSGTCPARPPRSPSRRPSRRTCSRCQASGA